MCVFDIIKGGWKRHETKNCIGNIVPCEESMSGN